MEHAFQRTEHAVVRAEHAAEHIEANPSVLCSCEGKVQWCNDEWLTMAGLPSAARVKDLDALRLLNGPGTNKDAVADMRAAICRGDDWTGTLVHYTADDFRPFIHTLRVQPVPSAYGASMLFRATSTSVRHIGPGARSGSARKRPSHVDYNYLASAAAQLMGDVDLVDGATCGPPLKMCKAVGVSASDMKVICSTVAPYPIVWASEGWLAQCAFSATEVIGVTLRIIQGPGTDRTAVAHLMQCVREGQDIERLKLVNYDKQKNPFAHHLSVRLVQRGGRAVFDATSTEVRFLSPPRAANTSSSEMETWGETVEEFLQEWCSFSSAN